jgi:hypothetical protein
VRDDVVRPSIHIHSRSMIVAFSDSVLPAPADDPNHPWNYMKLEDDAEQRYAHIHH